MSSKLRISAPLASTPLVPKSTPLQQFKSHPSRFIANWLYKRRPSLASPTAPHVSTAVAGPAHDQSLITLVCISDTHNSTPSPIPAGDVILHAGDLTNKGTFAELQAQLDWINTLPHPHKVVIGGNHDILLDSDFIINHPERINPNDIDRGDQLEWGNITYLNGTSTTITVRGRKLTIFGLPLTPQCGTFAFQYSPIRDVWRNLIPAGTDIVLTHGPPKGHLDLGGKGCEWLLRELWRLKPRVVVFGHIHGGRGREVLAWDRIQYGYDFPSLINVAIMALALAWSCISNIFSSRKVAKTWLINAAVGEEAIIADVIMMKSFASVDLVSIAHMPGETAVTPDSLKEAGKAIGRTSKLLTKGHLRWIALYSLYVRATSQPQNPAVRTVLHPDKYAFFQVWHYLETPPRHHRNLWQHRKSFVASSCIIADQLNMYLR